MRDVLILLFSPLIDVALVAVALSVVSFVLQRKLVNRDELKKLQDSMKDKQKEMNELLKRQDQQAKQELDRLQKEMMDATTAIMQKSMKQMFATLIIVLPVFWYLGFAYGKTTIALPFELPFIGSGGSWIIWYIIVSFVTSIALMVIEKVFKKKKVD